MSAFGLETSIRINVLVPMHEHNHLEEIGRMLEANRKKLTPEHLLQRPATLQERPVAPAAPVAASSSLAGES